MENETLVEFDTKTVIYFLTEFEKYRRTHQAMSPTKAHDWGLMPPEFKPSMFSMLSNVMVEVVAGIALIVIGAATLGFAIAGSLPFEVLFSTAMVLFAGVVVFVVAFPLGRLVSKEK